jgi:hypothetical protein
MSLDFFALSLAFFAVFACLMTLGWHSDRSPAKLLPPPGPDTGALNHYVIFGR